MIELLFPVVEEEKVVVLNSEMMPHNKASTERSLARRLALQALYELDSTDHALKDVMSHFLSREQGSLSMQAIISVPEEGEITNFEPPLELNEYEQYLVGTDTHLGDKFVSINDLIETRLVEGEEEQRVVRYFTRLVHGIAPSRNALDNILQDYAPDFPIDQVAIIDRNILRIALYEIGIEHNIPLSVAIDEAVELSKVFGAEATTRFVNGVLGAIAVNLDEIRQELKEVLAVDEANA
jgi:transcription antitermination protein NusB